MPLKTRLADISVFAPDEVPREQLEIGGPYTVATQRHLLSALGWASHEECGGTGQSDIGLGCQCFEGLVPPEWEVHYFTEIYYSDHDFVVDALVLAEHMRKEKLNDGVDLDSGGGVVGLHQPDGLRSLDATQGPASDEALEVSEHGVPDDQERG